MLPKLFEDSSDLLPNPFIFQQDVTPAHMSRQTQEWIALNSPDFISKVEWPPNSPDLNPLNYHISGATQKPETLTQTREQGAAEACSADNLG